MKRKQLFEDDEDEGSCGRLSENAEYARKYEEKKKREEYANLMSAYGPSGTALSDDEDAEVEDEGVEPQKFQDEFLKVIPMISQRSTEVYDPSSSFFSAQEEQDSLRREFAAAVERADQGVGVGVGVDDLLTRREKTQEESHREEEEFGKWSQKRSAASGQAGSGGSERKSGPVGSGDEVLMRYWKDGSGLDAGERFLRRYVWKKMWLDDEERRREGLDGVDDDEEEQDEEVKKLLQGHHVTPQEEEEEDSDEEEREEEFEHRYNTRFEEGGQLTQFPRQVEGSERANPKALKRAAKRKEREERKKEEKERKKEDVDRLKTLQRERIRERLAQIQKAAGVGELPIDEEELEEDFDPDKLREKLESMFGEEYYSRGESEDPEKPVFEHDPLIDSTEPISVVPPVPRDEEGEKAAQEEAVAQGGVLVGKHLKKKQKKMAAKDEDGEEDESEEVPDKEKAAKEAAELIEGYYKLDFEDMIGDMPCRFKYVTVPEKQDAPRARKLTPEQILSMDDEELDRVMPIRQMAPYADPSEQRRPQRGQWSRGGRGRFGAQRGRQASRGGYGRSPRGGRLPSFHGRPRGGAAGKTTRRPRTTPVGKSKPPHQRRTRGDE